MTKTYNINGKEIEGLHGNTYYIRSSFMVEEIVGKINELLEALDGIKKPIKTAEENQLEALSEKEVEPFKEAKTTLDKLRKEVRQEIEKKEPKEDVCFSCSGTGIYRYEEPKEECNCTEMFNNTIADTSDCKIHADYVRLEEAKEECKHDDPYRSGAGTCRECGLHYEEPKSTLKEEMARIINLFGTPSITRADKIISLFKDTLLKEIRNKRRSVGYANYVYEEDLIEIIQNL